MSGISGVLALMLTLANQYIANYGECTITINQDKEYVVEGGSTLLSTLNEQELFLLLHVAEKEPVVCVNVLSTKVEDRFFQLRHPFLTEDDMKNNVRLSCQVKVKSDMQLGIPERFAKCQKV